MHNTKEFSVIHYSSKPGLNPEYTVWLQAKKSNESSQLAKN